MLGDAYNVVGFDRAGPPYLPIEVECVSVDLTSDYRIRRVASAISVWLRAGFGDSTSF